MKHSITYLLLLCILPFFATSCEKEEDIQIDFRYEITHPLIFIPDKEIKEMEAIKLAYTDAFKNAKIKHNEVTLIRNTPESIILKACHEAEGAILTSPLKFNTSYTFTVVKMIEFEKDTIYRKVYGVRLDPNLDLLNQ